MKITCGAEVPIAGETVEDLIAALKALPPEAGVKSIGFDDGRIRVWWEEERPPTIKASTGPR